MTEERSITIEAVNEFFAQPHVTASSAEPTEMREVPAERLVNIDGSIVAKHDIDLKGRTLWIKGDASFEGNVCNGEVVALGHINAQKSCDACVFYAHSAINLVDAVNSKIFSYRNISLGNDIQRCVLTSAGSINGAHAVVQTGRLSASKNIIIRRAYSLANQGVTTLMSGERKVVLHKWRLLQRQIVRLDDILQHTKQSIHKLIKILFQQRQLDESNDLLVSLKSKQKVVESALDVKRREFQLVDDYMSKRAVGEIAILQHSSSDIQIYIGERRHQTASAITGKTIFSFNGAGIIATFNDPQKQTHAEVAQ